MNFNNISYEPCPFCGGQPEGRLEVTRWSGDEVVLWLGLKCPNCHIERGYSIHSEGKIDFKDFLSYIENTVNAWNTRYNPDLD